MSQALCKGLDTLKVLSSKRSVGVTEVAEAIGVNKSTAFRILKTLQEYNMAEQDPVTNRYKLGPAILMMTDRFAKNIFILDMAKPLMINLVEEMGESCHLCILSNGEVVMIEQIATKYRYGNNSKIGIKEPLHASSVGKCLVAFSKKDLREKLIQNNSYEIYNDKTIKNQAEFKVEIEKIRMQGFALDNFEISNDVRCVALPILGKDGIAKYSIGVSGESLRMSDKKLKKIIIKLQEISKVIEAEIKKHY